MFWCFVGGEVGVDEGVEFVFVGVCIVGKFDDVGDSLILFVIWNVNDEGVVYGVVFF